MVSIKALKSYCSGDITKIENYEKAVNDPNVKYECHHRLEEQGYSAHDLIKMNRYYKVPPEELKLMTPKEHRQLHHTGKEITVETKRKLSEFRVGRKATDETKRKNSEAHKGEKNPMYGKTHNEKTKKKMSNSHKSTPKVYCKELDKIFSCHQECNDYIAKYLGIKHFNVGLYLKKYKGCYAKGGLTFYEIIDDPNQLQLDL